MTISELIKMLEDAKAQEGDIQVCWTDYATGEDKPVTGIYIFAPIVIGKQEPKPHYVKLI